MRKVVKRVLVGFAFFMFALAIFCMGAFVLYKGTPEWYAAKAQSREQVLSAAWDAEDKLAQTQNWAAMSNADQIRIAAARAAGTSAPSRATDTHVITFSENELNALFQKWSAFYHWPDAYGRFLEDPRIVLQDGRVILAGRLKDLGTIASVHFEPRLDENGKLRMDIVRLLGGRLPLPEVFFNGQRDRVLASIRRHAPTWQREAGIDAGGAANAAAMSIALGRAFDHALNHQPAEPVLFLPIIEHKRWVPVQLTAVSVEEGSISLTVRALDGREREALLARIRSDGPINRR